MFNNKEHDHPEYLTRFEVVPCDECKCLIEQRDAQKVSTSMSMGSFNSYYCKQHRKPYNSIHAYESLRFFGEVEMDIDGTPVGYVKAKAKPDSGRL